MTKNWELVIFGLLSIHDLKVSKYRKLFLTFLIHNKSTILSTFALGNIQDSDFLLVFGDTKICFRYFWIFYKPTISFEIRKYSISTFLRWDQKVRKNWWPYSWKLIYQKKVFHRASIIESYNMLLQDFKLLYIL